MNEKRDYKIVTKGVQIDRCNININNLITDVINKFKLTHFYHFLFILMSSHIAAINPDHPTGPLCILVFKII